jgi:hypothetical protein
MRNLWLALLVSAMFATSGLLWSAGRSANAHELAGQSRAALIVDGALNSAAPGLEYVAHNSCGVSLGGWCPRGVRSCLREGKPKSQCETWGDRCDACSQAMVSCREKVGHRAGFTCTKCRQAWDKCRDALLPLTK